VLNRSRAVIVAIVLACGAVAKAAEYGGVVTGAGVPIPGATITATRQTSRFVTTSDQAGAFRFADLEDGHWTIRIEMLGFAAATRTSKSQPASNHRSGSSR
jgi:uncharacterized GH25 family protein